MAASRSVRGAVMWLGVLSVVLVAACDLPVPSAQVSQPPSSQQEASPSQLQPGADAVLGDWLGKAIGVDEATCGLNTGEFILQGDGIFFYQQATQRCGTWSKTGHFEVSAGTIVFHDESIHACLTCPLLSEWTLGYQSSGSSLTLCDGPNCGTWYRKSP